ncbi:MAG: O-antigen ligase family protein [Agathobacter sp.]|nr:O-antigen ligase family protein [Agathobacter sp.]
MIAAWCVSLYFSFDRYECFIGNQHKKTGLLFYIIAILTAIIIRKNLKWKTSMTWCLIASTGIVSLLQILNRWGIDPLGYWSQVSETDQPWYISTLGQINYNAAFVCLTLSIVICMFILCREKRKKIIFGTVMVIGFAGGICCCADGFYVGMLVAFLIVFAYACIKPKFWKEAWSLCLCWWIANAMISILYNFLPGNNTGIWGVSEKILDIKVIALETVLLIAFYLVVRFGNEFLEKNALWIKRIYAGIISLMCLVPAVLFIVATWQNFPENHPLHWFVFNEQWGTNRGSIWIKAVKLFEESDIIHKLFGYGHNMVALSLSEVLGINKGGIVIADVHNTYLNMLITSGIIGLILFLIAMIYLLKNGIRLIKENKESGLFVVAGTGTYLAQALINGPQSITSPIVLLGFGIFLGIIFNNSDKEIE